MIAALGWLGVVPGVVVFAQTSEGSVGSLAPWITGGAVLTLASLMYKVMNSQLERSQAKNDAYEARIAAIADEDRKTIVPVLAQATMILSKFADEPRKD